MTRAVFDSSPLIFLDALGYVALLPRLFEVWVTPAVIAELTAQPSKPGASVARLSWLQKGEAKEPHVLEQLSSLNLGTGETSSIALALETKSTVVLDDALARKRARQFDLSVLGTVGIVMLLHRQDLVEGTLENDLKRLVKQGMWLDDALIAELVAANKFD
jgi:uncharacterized protein